jgi:hypothetical protein
MAVNRSFLSGLILSAVLLTGPNAPANTAATRMAVPPSNLSATHDSTAALVPMPPNPSATLEPNSGVQTKSPVGTRVTVPDSTTDEETRVNEESNALAAIVSRQNSITEQIGKLETQGLDLLEWGPDEKNNAVWISLRNYTEEKADLARKILGEDLMVKPATIAGNRNDLFSRTSD